MDAAALTEALYIAESAGTVREAAAALRQRLAPLKVVVMDAFDMRRERHRPRKARSARCTWAPATATAGR